MKNILAIDPALKNLAICDITFDENNKIIDLSPHLIDIMKTKTANYETIMKNLIKELDDVDLDGVDIVLIENQPSRLNMKVKSVAVALYTYFLMKKKQVYFISPSLKLSKEENKLSYSKRKKLSIEKVKEHLDGEIFEKIDEFDKMDDLCDCILMAKMWMEKH